MRAARRVHPARAHLHRVEDRTKILPRHPEQAVISREVLAAYLFTDLRVLVPQKGDLSDQSPFHSKLLPQGLRHWTNPMKPGTDVILATLMIE